MNAPREDGEDSKRGAIPFGLGLMVFGAIIGYAGYHDYGFGGPFFPGLAVGVTGIVLVGAAILRPAVDVLRGFGGVVCALAGLACITAGLVVAVTGQPQALGLLPFGLLWLAGAALCFDAPRRLANRGLSEERLSRILGGSIAMIVGVSIAVMVAGDPSRMADGFSPWVGVGAGGVFFLAGLSIITDTGRDGLLQRTVTAVFLSVFAAITLAVFPPGGLLVAFIAVQGWVAVYRSVHQRVLGRDPLAGLSQERALGVGCLVTVILTLLVAASLWLVPRDRDVEASPKLPAEAPDSPNDR